MALTPYVDAYAVLMRLGFILGCYPCFGGVDSLHVRVWPDHKIDGIKIHLRLLFAL